MLTIVNISNPINPSIVANVTSTILGGVRDVYVSGKYAYVGTITSDTFAVIDISGIDAPTATIGNIQVGSLHVTENKIVANDLYVGNGVIAGSGGILSQGPVAADSLSVNDTLKLKPRATAPSVTENGSMYFDSTTNVLCIYNGTDWFDWNGNTCS